MKFDDKLHPAQRYAILALNRLAANYAVIGNGLHKTPEVHHAIIEDLQEVIDNLKQVDKWEEG